MIILDSNVWVAYLNKNDSQHKKAEEIFSHLTAGLAVPEYVILEVCSVLTLKANKSIADKFLEFITDNQDIEILFSNHVFFTGVIVCFKNTSQQKLSFTDIALVYLSKTHKVITFDKQLEKAIKQASAKSWFL